MPSGSYMQSYVQCPFYQEDDGTSRIRCEGFDKAKSLIQYYRYKRQFNKKLLEVCCGNFKACGIYRGLMATKYADT